MEDNITQNHIECQCGVLDENNIFDGGFDEVGDRLAGLKEELRVVVAEEFVGADVGFFFPALVDGAEGRRVCAEGAWVRVC